MAQTHNPCWLLGGVWRTDKSDFLSNSKDFVPCDLSLQDTYSFKWTACLIRRFYLIQEHLHSNSCEGNPWKCWIKSLEWQRQWSSLYEVLQGTIRIQPISNDPGDTATPHASVSEGEGWLQPLNGKDAPALHTSDNVWVAAGWGINTHRKGLVSYT